MSTTRTFGVLEPSDLKRYRRILAQQHLLQSWTVPVVPFEDAARILERYWEFMGDVSEKYNVPPDSNYSVSPWTGVIMEGE